MPDQHVRHNTAFEREMSQRVEQAACALERIAGWLEQAHFHQHQVVSKDDLKELGERIMASISDFAGTAKQGLVTIGVKVDAIASDVAYLKQKIEELQGTQGTVTPEDQALLDDLQAGIQGLTDKLTELDDATAGPIFQPEEPAPPVTETPTEKALRMERNMARGKGVPADGDFGAQSGQRFAGETSSQRTERERAEREQQDRDNQRRNK